MDGKPEGVSERERANQFLRRNDIRIGRGIHRKPLTMHELNSYSGGCVSRKICGPLIRLRLCRVSQYQTFGACCRNRFFPKKDNAKAAWGSSTTEIAGTVHFPSPPSLSNGL